jgi:hypothetical protein
MDHMLFPRYIGHEARDFFYLTSRDVPPDGAAPDAHLVFADTPIVPAEAWRARQATR